MLSFLRYSLAPDEQPIPESATSINWTELKEFAKEHSIVGIYWQGIQRLASLPCNRPTDDDIMAWMALVTKIQKRNRFMDERTDFVAETFASEGFPNVILKGQGNAAYYPDPSLRTSGDIDIWLLAPRHTITRYVQNLCPDQKPIYLHIAFPKVKEVEVEVHFMPSYLNNPLCNRRLQRWFKEHIPTPLLTSPKERKLYQEGDSSAFARSGGVSGGVPFNLVYQLCHIMHHIFDEGIGLRQLIDYYYLLRQAEDVDRTALCRQLSSYNMLGFARGILWIEHDVLGLPERYLYAQPDECRGRVLLADILRGGNFGKHNDDYEHASKRRIYPRRAWKKLRHNLRLARYFPSEALCEPLFRTWHFFWRMM